MKHVERLLVDVPITSTKLRRLCRQHPTLTTHLYMLSGLVLSPTDSVDGSSSSFDRSVVCCLCHLLGRLRVDLIKLVSNVRPPVRTSVRLYTKSFFDFNEIWYAGRGRRVMHDGMQYDPIHIQGQGHEPLKVGNSAIFNGYLLPHL